MRLSVCYQLCVCTKSKQMTGNPFHFLFCSLSSTKQSFTGSVNEYYSSSLFHPLLQSITPLRRNYVEEGFDDLYLILTV